MGPSAGSVDGSTTVAELDVGSITASLEVGSMVLLEPGTGFSVPAPGLFANCMLELSSLQAVSAIAVAIPRTLNDVENFLNCIRPLEGFHFLHKKI